MSVVDLHGGPDRHRRRPTGTPRSGSGEVASVVPLSAAASFDSHRVAWSQQMLDPGHPVPSPRESELRAVGVPSRPAGQGSWPDLRVACPNPVIAILFGAYLNARGFDAVDVDNVVVVVVPARRGQDEAPDLSLALQVVLAGSLEGLLDQSVALAAYETWVAAVRG